jgi:hypothetical protein
VRVFVFRSIRDGDVLGFTPDQRGANLPAPYAPWHPAVEGGAILVGNDPDANTVLEAIRRDGFFLAIGGYEDEDRPPAVAH